ncbi:AGD9 [Symbiodinium sp. CCMP2456]|nr:AGD9 [Symbiodinium sp. CCMP2456]
MCFSPSMPGFSLVLTALLWHAWVALASRDSWTTLPGAPRFRYAIYGMATQPPAGPSYLLTSRGLFRVDVEGSDASMVKVWNATTNFGSGGELSMGETGLMLVTKFGLRRYAWYRRNSTSDWESLIGVWNKNEEFPAADEVGAYPETFSDNRYQGYAHPWRAGPDGRIYVMLKRRAEWPAPDQIPESGTRDRYAIWSYDLDDGVWRRATPDLPNFRGKTLKTYTRGCPNCQGVSGFNGTVASWSGKQQVKYGNGKLCGADQDPEVKPQCWKPQGFSLPTWGGNHTRGLYLRACHGEVRVERFVLATVDNLTGDILDSLPVSDFVDGTWQEVAGEPLVIDPSMATQLVPTNGKSEESTVRTTAGGIIFNGTFEVRGTQQNAATEAAHAEYKVRFQPIEKANAACSQGLVEKRYVYLKAQSLGTPRPHVWRHCVDVLTTGYFNQWHPRFEFTRRPDGSLSFYAGNTGVDSVSRCDDSPEAQPDTGIVLLEDGVWRGLTGPDTKYRKEGFTCGWGQSKIYVSADRRTLFSTGGSGQYYSFDEEKGWWLPLDEASYGDARGFFTQLTQQRSEPNLVHADGSGDEATDPGIYHLPKPIDQADCSDLGRALAGFAASHRQQQDLGNEERTVAEALAEKKPKPLRRGHVWHAFDESRLARKTLPMHLATYHPFNSQCQSESVVSAFLLENASQIVTCGRFPSMAEPDQVVWLSSSTGERLRTASLPGKASSCGEIPGGGPVNLFVAGDFGLVGIGEDGEAWAAPVTEVVATSAVRGGRVAVVTSNKTVAVFSASSGALVAQRSFGYSYVTAVELFTDGRVAVGAYTNNRATNAVQIARMEIYSADLQERLTQTWGMFTARQLDDAHNMADTRVYGLVLDDIEEHVYVAGESAGGNTIFRWNGQDLSTNSARDTGTPMWMAKSDAHVGYVGRVRASDGVVVGGTFIAPILRSAQRLNTFRMKGSALQFDAESNSLYVMGTSTCCIPGRTAFTLAGQRVDGGDPAGYAGSDPSLVAFDSELRQRRAWTTFSSWRNKGTPAGLSIQNGIMTIAVTTHGGQAITTPNALFPNASEAEDHSCDVPEDTKLTDVWLAVLPSLPPVGTPKFPTDRQRRTLVGRLRLRVRSAETFVDDAATRRGLRRGVARALQVPEENVNITSVSVVPVGGRRLSSLGELLVEYTVTETDESPLDTAALEEMVQEVEANSTAVLGELVSAIAELAPEFATSIEEVDITAYSAESSLTSSRGPQTEPSTTIFSNSTSEELLSADVTESTTTFQAEMDALSSSSQQHGAFFWMALFAMVYHAKWR